MYISTVPIAALLLATSLALPQPTFGKSRRSGIQWTSCDLESTDDLNRTVPILCGTVKVPLDYTTPNCSSTIELPLLKIPAANGTTKMPTVLTNYGGPGINGTVAMIGLGVKQQSIIGLDRDLITWQPRGTDANLLFSCYADAATRTQAAVAYPSVLGNASDVAQGQLWMNSEIFTDSCKEIASQNASLIGTAFTARDMMQIVDALGEDGLLRYWGYSYGSVLGFTAAAMFPERVESIIIDGVVNAADYYHGYELTSRESSDDALLGFCEGCIANPSQCPLAQNHTTSADLYAWIFQLIDTSKFHPIVLPNTAAAGGDLGVTYTPLKNIIYNMMYTPATWSNLSQILHAVDVKDPGPIIAYLSSTAGSPPEIDADSEFGIGCGDKFPRADSLDALEPYLDSLRTSRLGGDIEDGFSITCAQWPFEAKERYSGPFTGLSTRKPLLVIGNTWDPATPLASARNVSQGFEGSVLLEQRGYGHSSIAQASLCTQSAVRRYFAEGVLPDVGTVCEVDEPAFPTVEGDVAAWAAVLQGLEQGKNGTSVV